MPWFWVDDEVVSLIWSRARPKPFENLSFDNALRRVLGQPGSAPQQGDKPLSASEHTQKPDHRPSVSSSSKSGGASEVRRRGRAPKADLQLLVHRGLLREGEPLYLVDYKGNRLEHPAATVRGPYLQFQGEIRSMSELARGLLHEHGYTSDSVRGPAHWTNSSGKSVRELWENA